MADAGSGLPTSLLGLVLGFVLALTGLLILLTLSSRAAAPPWRAYPAPPSTITDDRIRALVAFETYLRASLAKTLPTTTGRFA